MKKGWKIFLGVCGGVAVLGLVLALTGKAMGTDFSSFKPYIKSGTEYRYIQHMDWDDFWDDSDDDWDDDWDDEYHSGETTQSNGTTQSNETAQSGESTQSDAAKAAGVEYKGVTSIDLSVGAGEVIIEPYDGSSVVVDSSGVANSHKLFIEAEEEDLEVEWKTGTVTSSVGVLKIYVPKQGIAELSAKTGAGALDIRGVTVGDLDIELGAGEANIAADVQREADFECGAGQMNVSLPGTESDYNYNLKCGIGKIQVGSKAYEGLANKTKVNNNAVKNIDIDCGIGEVNVAFQ